MFDCCLVVSFCECIIAFVFPEVSSVLLVGRRGLVYLRVFFLEEFGAGVPECWLRGRRISSLHFGVNRT